ncbi:nucleotidyl transferase AbiEii/AbiGii toxin family protein [Candidatus Dojkabacteria bacterium]|nr:nucleotidyl transferase AbiEii/AbiGii toxin family protein [Candidatus Dojkabacteria bacterium]
MISLKEINSSYPPKLQMFSLGILREYIQYKILEAIYGSRYNNNLVFMGGTALRIVHNNQRFSEDLDFDNVKLNKLEFESLVGLVKSELTLEGFQVETRVVYKKAFHCYIKIPDILYKEGLSDLPNQKITIRIDTMPQNYIYSSEVHLLDKFDVYQNIKVVPISTLLSQKIAALLERKRSKGRDFFDVSFLISQNIKPDMVYLRQKLGTTSSQSLKQRLAERAREADLTRMAADVKPFLFDKSHAARVINFISQTARL